MAGTRVQASAPERNARELVDALRAVRRVAMLAKRQGDAGRRLINLELRNVRLSEVKA